MGDSFTFYYYYYYYYYCNCFTILWDSTKISYAKLKIKNKKFPAKPNRFERQKEPTALSFSLYINTVVPSNPRNHFSCNLQEWKDTHYSNGGTRHQLQLQVPDPYRNQGPSSTTTTTTTTTTIHIRSCWHYYFSTPRPNQVQLLRFPLSAPPQRRHMDHLRLRDPSRRCLLRHHVCQWLLEQFPPRLRLQAAWEALFSASLWESLAWSFCFHVSFFNSKTKSSSSIGFFIWVSVSLMIPSLIGEFHFGVWVSLTWKVCIGTVFLLLIAEENRNGFSSC